MTETNEPAMPKDSEEYGQELIFAFTLGMNCTFEALKTEDQDVLKVFNTAKDVASGRLYLGATGAELRLKGLDIPAEIEQGFVKSQQRLATIVCHYFARFLFRGLSDKE